MKKYQIIYADPPWSYNDKMSGHSFSLDHEYETQDIDWIKSLNVNKLADINCVLFMWSVSPMLPEAIDVIKSWGFKYKTIAFCWSKYTDTHKEVANLGRWTMGNVELCLLGVKGKPKRISKNVRQLVKASRHKHSAKLTIVRDLIVELMGDLPRIELFGRPNNQLNLEGKTTFDGWDVWGNEFKSDIEL